MRRTLAALGVAALVVATFWTAIPASAGTIVVAPGESINDAVASAQPGDTIQLQAGVYEDVVVIKTNDITIQGVGSGTDGSILRPPAVLPGRCFGGIAGICVRGNGQTGTPVSGVTVTGVRAEAFVAFGFVALLAENLTLEDNAGVDNGEYGLAAFESSGVVMRNNIGSGNGLAGLYIGDSPSADATLEGNEVFDNAYGLFLRDAKTGTVAANTIHDNCIGILVFNTSSPIHAARWTITGNTIENNSRFCPGGGGGDPSLSGIGIAIAGGRRNTVEGNLIQNNRTNRNVAFHGGVVLIRLDFAPKNNEVTGNTLFRNRPNIFSDGSGTGNVITGNTCTPPC
jgi:parallel beta-helix repeat protein